MARGRQAIPELVPLVTPVIPATLRQVTPVIPVILRQVTPVIPACPGRTGNLDLQASADWLAVA